MRDKSLSEYRTWVAMKQRCQSSNCRAYKNYGGRGIKVCDKWLNSFDAFIKDMGDRPDGYSIERIDNDGNYEPSNCKWATRREQQINRRVHRNNTSGYRGVQWHKKDNCWRAVIMSNRTHIHIGNFRTKEEAALAYNRSAREHHGELAHLNNVKLGED